MQAYLGVDIGSISTKAAVIDAAGNLLAQGYLWTEGDPVTAVKTLLARIKAALPGGADILACGTTGSARRLIGAMLDARVVKNEITAHAVGTMSKYPDARTILEIGGQDSKIILLQDGIVADYAMNTLCAAGTGAFLSSQAKRLGIPVEEIGEYALRSEKPARIAARCTVFAESDMVHKAQCGYSKADLMAGLCDAVVANYLNNVGKGKKVMPPVIFQGGVSKNAGVVRAFERAIGQSVRVDEASHLMGAIGVALLAQRSGGEARFDFGVADMDFRTRGAECGGCANRCEVVGFFQGRKLLDAWGSRCEKGLSLFAEYDMMSGVR